jgi:hypothetical protein
MDSVLSKQRRKMRTKLYKMEKVAGNCLLKITQHTENSIKLHLEGVD